MGAAVINHQLAKRLLSEAAAAPDREICGLLFGTGDRIEAARAAANVAADPACRFEIDPAALIAAHKVQRAGGPGLIGCYHSHPGGRAEPSAIDCALAEPGALWIILAGDDIRLWRADQAGFCEVNLIFA